MSTCLTGGIFKLNAYLLCIIKYKIVYTELQNKLQSKLCPSSTIVHLNNLYFAILYLINIIYVCERNTNG